MLVCEPVSACSKNLSFNAEESDYWYTRWVADILLQEHLLDKAMTMMIDIFLQG